MFGHRTDGKEIKSSDPLFSLIPLIMKKRSDAHVYYTEDISLEPLNEYIDKKSEEGYKISYMDIIYAALVRVIAERPLLNRFVMNGRTYARNNIEISLAIKKSLSDGSPETVLKIPFDGHENIFEIKDKLENEIIVNKQESNENDTDKLAKVMTRIPHWVMKLAVNFIIMLDKHGYLPKSIIKASPFHASAFLTNVGSLGIDSIYHHIYDFGTVGLFLAMGKKKKSFIYDDENNNFKQESSISISLVGDERICDGFYFANAIKSFKRYLKKPEVLEKNITPVKDA